MRSGNFCLFWNEDRSVWVRPGSNTYTRTLKKCSNQSFLWINSTFTKRGFLTGSFFTLFVDSNSRKTNLEGMHLGGCRWKINRIRIPATTRKICLPLNTVQKSQKIRFFLHIVCTLLVRQKIIVVGDPTTDLDWQKTVFCDLIDML